MKKTAVATFIPILISVLVLSTCSATASPAASSPIILTTVPNPPKRGPVELIVDVKDAQGQPLGDFVLSVSDRHETDHCVGADAIVSGLFGFMLRIESQEMH